MTDLATRLLHALARPSYTPVKPKVLAKRLGCTGDDYPEFRRTLRQLVHDGRVEVGRNSTVRAADPYGSLVGTFRRTANGHGVVRPLAPTEASGPEVHVRPGRDKDASGGDEVLVRLTRRASKAGTAGGEVVRILRRATRTFVGTYFERSGTAYVRVDGTVFAHSVLVGDPGAKGAKPNDKVVIDLLKFPTADGRGEGVITEVLGPLSQPGVDTLSVIKAFGLPEAFPEAALDEARAAADTFREADLHGRTDFTGDCVVTIDPVDARDFDDAVGVEPDPKTGGWVLTVHIADVGHFCPAGGRLDAEARKRATSVYLPQRVIPMFPEVISNGLASLQQDRVRYVKTVRMAFGPAGEKGHVEFFNAAIRNRRRFTYEQVQQIYDRASRPREGTEGTPAPPPPHGDGSPAPGCPVAEDVRAVLFRLRDLALALRAKRRARGALELTMPEPVLEYDADGKVSGARFAANTLSHQVIEEAMLAANVAVAEHFSRLGVPFLRRVHPAPADDKLERFAQFSGLLGHRIRRPEDRFELQRVLDATADKPERAALHFALLRSLKQASYSPVQDEHYALAYQDYCHFTSPIRRYPDLLVHRLFERWLKTGKASGNEDELKAVGEHCSRMERRAETAERELVKLKLLQHLATRVGDQFDAVITGVADYGFFAQATTLPAEGLVHVSSLADDFYRHDEGEYALTGSRGGKRYRLGDRVRVAVARVDVPRRLLDFRLVRPGG
jgi:ribonuclease R